MLLVGVMVPVMFEIWLGFRIDEVSILPVQIEAIYKVSEEDFQRVKDKDAVYIVSHFQPQYVGIVLRVPQEKDRERVSHSLGMWFARDIHCKIAVWDVPKSAFATIRRPLDDTIMDVELKEEGNLCDILSHLKRGFVYYKGWQQNMRLIRSSDIKYSDVSNIPLKIKVYTASVSYIVSVDKVGEVCGTVH